MGDATLYTVLPTHPADAGIALSSVGVILGINRAVRIVFNGPAGLAYDRWPRRYLFVPSLFIGALSTAIYAATKGFWPLLVGRVLWGLAWSGIWVGGTTMILDVTSNRERGRWAGLYEGWFFGGHAVGSLVGGLLTDRVGYAASMWIGAILTAAGGVVAMFLLPETRGAPPGHAAASDAVGAHPSGRDGTWVAAWMYGINRFVIAGVLAATLGLLVKGWATVGGLGTGVATVTGLLMAGRTLLSTGAAPVAGAASDRLGSRWKVALWTLAMGAIGMALIALGGPAAVLAGLSLGAVAGGGVRTVSASIVGDSTERGERGRAVGLLHTAGDLGSAVGPPVAYALLPWLGPAGLYLVCAGLYLVGLVPVLWFRSRDQRLTAMPIDT
jgi:MFS family permease